MGASELKKKDAIVAKQHAKMAREERIKRLTQLRSKKQAAALAFIIGVALTLFGGQKYMEYKDKIGELNSIILE